MTTFGEALAAAAARVERHVDSPRREARLLLALAAGIDDVTVLAYPERTLPPAAAERLERLVARRMAGEPYSRIAGRREFWSLDFCLGPETLDPRPDSEILVATGLELLPERAASLRLLDLGTGSGCLLLALLSERPNAYGVGIDLAPGAVLAARRNAVLNRLESRAFFAAGRWGDGLRGGFDLVLANPPYLAADAIPALPPEVARFDPPLALDGGPDGLRAYRELAPDLARLGAVSVVEVGVGQADDVEQIFAREGLDVRARRCDLSGIERCLVCVPSKKTIGMRTLPV